MDSTVERVYASNVDIPTFSDEALRQLIREFRNHGIDVYLTLAFEAYEAETATRPVRRWQLGDSAPRGVPPDNSNIYRVDIDPNTGPGVQITRITGVLSPSSGQPIRNRRCILPE